MSMKIIDPEIFAELPSADKMSLGDKLAFLEAIKKVKKERRL